MAVVGYSGFWSEKRFLRYKKELELWIEKNGLKTIGEPIWARLIRLSHRGFYDEMRFLFL